MFDLTETPRYYPYGTTQNAGKAHVRLHQATRAAGIKLGVNKNPGLTDAQLLKAYEKAYSDPSLNGIRGDLRTPNGKTVIAQDVTPAEAFQQLLEWEKSK